jgi:uncharacterized protein (DUF488 family)
MNMATTAYTFGYTGKKPDALAAWVEQTKSVVVDIRFSPYSRNPAWGQANLKRLLGQQYYHCKALGNKHYRGGGPMELLDPAEGVRLVQLLALPPVLMCMCPTFAECHRSLVADLLGRHGITTEELELSGGGPVAPADGRWTELPMF